MLEINTKLFRKNFFFCKLMFDKAIYNEQVASSNKNYEEANREAVKQQLILKLAFLELAGWIEATLDEIYLSIAKTVTERELIERHICFCNGFKEKNVRDCLKFCLGDKRYDNFKNKYKKLDKQRAFFNKLENLAEYRNSYAHTCLDTGALASSPYGRIKQIQEDFIFLLRCFSVLLKELRVI